MMKTTQKPQLLMSPPTKGGALFIHKELSSHLLSWGYPEKSLNNLESCGQNTDFLLWRSCGCENRKDFIGNGTYKCRHRLCPTCSQLRKKQFRRDLYPFLKKNRNNPLYSIKFMTISPLNYTSYDEGLKDIRKGFIKFLRRKYNDNEFVKDRIQGGFYVIDTKQSKKGWNIHLHILIYSKYLDNRYRGKCLDCNYSLLKRDRISNNYYCASKKCNSTNVTEPQKPRLRRVIESAFKRPCMVDISDPGKSASDCLSYLLKYVSANKSDFLTTDAMAECIVKTHKQKTLSRFGTFFKDNGKYVKIPALLWICPTCKEPIHYTGEYMLSPTFAPLPQGRPLKPPDQSELISF